MSNLAKNTISSILNKIITIVCGFIVPRLILEYYGSGINGLVSSIAQFLNLIAFLELGIGAVVQYSLYKPLYEKDDKLVSMILVSAQRFFNKIGIILLVYIGLLIILYPRISNYEYDMFFTAVLIVIIGISLIAQYFFGIVNSLLLESDQKGYINYITQSACLIANAAISVILIKLECSIQIVKFVSSIIFLIRPIVLMIYVKKNYHFDKNIKCNCEPIQHKWNGMAQHIAYVILDNIAIVVLTMNTSLNLVSVYSIYNMIILGVKNIVMSFTSGIQPFLGQLWAKQDTKALKNTFAWVEWSIHSVTTIFFGIAFTLLIPFIKIYTFGITDTNYILPILSMLITFSHSFHCYRLPYNIMILAAGHYKETQNNYIFAIIINILFTIIGVTLFSINGACLGMFLALLYQILWMAYYNSKNLLMWSFKRFIKQSLTDIAIILLHINIFRLYNTEIYNYTMWIFLALKASICMLAVFYIANKIIYKDNMLILENSIYNRLRNKLRYKF